MSLQDIEISCGMVRSSCARRERPQNHHPRFFALSCPHCRATMSDAAAAARGASEAGDDEKKEKMRRFTTHAFRKTPTGGHGHVLAWGWMYKQVRRCCSCHLPWFLATPFCISLNIMN